MVASCVGFLGTCFSKAKTAIIEGCEKNCILCEETRNNKEFVDAILQCVGYINVVMEENQITKDSAGKFIGEAYDSLRLVKNSFIGALAVGICALMFVIFRLGIICYNIFTCIYVVYYVYLVISVINYRIESGYIIKAIASDEKASDKSPDNENIEAELPPLAINPDAETQLSDALDKWVKEKQYVRNDQTVEVIATELGTTHAMLKWYFTNRMHTTFRTWRQNLRLMEAKRLLSDENIPTSAIHKLIGVADKSNFHKLFRKQEGMTPQEYRDKLKH